MDIVLWGTYDTGKPRIRILRDGLRASGVNLIEIHTPIWEDIEDKSGVHGVRKWLVRGAKLLLAYPRLVWRYLRAPRHDLVLVSYPGQLDVVILRLFAWLRRTPMVFDWFVSAYDTLVNDRHLLRKKTLLASLIWLGEWLASRLASVTFMDTAAHARRMEHLFGLVPGSIGHVWVGAELPFFEHAHKHPVCHDGMLNVLFYGQFIPLHGIDTIVEAARILRTYPIRITLIGRGQEAQRIRSVLDVDPLPNIEWLDWLPYAELPARIARADVCLGIFGTSGKAQSVIPNKVFQIIAAQRPLVTRDSEAIRELLDDTPPCTRLVGAGDATGLAEALQSCARRAGPPAHTDCHARTRNLITPPAVAAQFLALVARIPPRRGKSHDH